MTNNEQIVNDTFTDYYVECIDGTLTYPLPVAPGVRCYNGMGIIAPNSPPAPDGDDSCTFDGIRCLNVNGVFTNEGCQEWYRTCTNGILSVPTYVGQGNLCLQGTIETCDNCNCFEVIHRCSFNGLQCITEYGYQAQPNEATSYFIMCVNGLTTYPVAAPPFMKCKNGGFVYATSCDVILDDKKCDFCDKRCVDVNQNIVYNQCTDAYATCNNTTPSFFDV